MDRLRTTGWWTVGRLMLSVFLLSVSVVAYRNDLSSSRHGCVWSTIEKEQQHTTLLPPLLAPLSSSGLINNPLTHQSSPNAGGGFSLNCNLRTLSVDFWNYTFNREQIERTRVVRIKCSDKLFFESLLSPNQTLFQLRNLKEVQIESCKIRKVPKRVFASLTKLKSLTIRTQNTEWRSSAAVGLEIEHLAFEGLGLEYLDLSQNNIWSFSGSGNALCPLTSLITLNLTRNRITDIEEIISSGVDKSCELNVQNLDFSYNSIRRVGQDAFSRMKRTTALRLQNNLIGELDDTAFEGLSQLRLLNLSSNRIVALPPFIFKTNVELRELYLNNNTISALSPQVFAKQEQLLLLDLSRNTLSSQWVKGDMFQGLVRMVVLKLSHNQLSFIDSEIFRDLISLQALHLSNNRIETINPEAFQSLRNLHTLDLSKNRISYVDGKMLSNLFVLRQLYMDHNKIRKMDDDALKNCSSLQDLGLVGNSLTEVPEAFKTLKTVQTLDMGENKITFVTNTSFSGMNQLIGLRMVDNRLESLPPAFCPPKLRVLNLSQNRLNKLSSSTFTSCPELRVLRLDTNVLEELPPSLAPQLPSILWLNVSENRLTWVDTHLLPASIEWLDLSYNSIQSLTGPYLNSSVDSKRILTTTNTMPFHLRILDVSHNKLTKIDQAMIPSSLETLRLNHNELNSVAPKTFIFSSQLRRVELIGNQLENLSLESLQLPPIPSSRALPEFFLGENPFLCNCEMEWLTRVNQLTLSRQQPAIMDLHAIVCKTTFSRSTSISTSAPGSAIIPLVEAKPRDFLCGYKSHCFALCHCCEFDACDCEMSCPDNCTCYHDNSWSSNIVECSNLQYENVPSRIPMDATEIYLDGNNIFELKPHIFIGKKNLKSLYLNSSHLEVIRNKTFNGLKSLEILRLEDNLLSELHGYEFADLENLRELYLQNNLLRVIAQDTFSQIPFLQVLRLDGNHLRDFSVWGLSRNGYLNSVMLANNPWNCDCAYLNNFRSWVGSRTTIVVDFNLATCQIHIDDSSSSSSSNTDDDNDHHYNHHPTIASMCNSNSDITFNYEQTGVSGGSGNNEIEINNHISSMNGGSGSSAEKVAGPAPPPTSENHLNFSRLDNTNADNTFWALLLCLCAFLIVIFVILAIFRQEIYYWASNALLDGENDENVGNCARFCSHLLNFLCCCPGKYSATIDPRKNSCPSSSRGDDQEKLFDAYFLYSKKDEDMLIQKIVPELEDPTTASTTPGHKFRLCLHYRDLCLSPESPWNREMILSACDASKRVVILLSKTFLQSEWSSSTHFRTSIQSAIALHPKKIIFIVLPDFDQSVASISSELSNYSSTSTIKNSCVSWADKNFWSKFKRLLPTPSTIVSENVIINTSTPIHHHNTLSHSHHHHSEFHQNQQQQSCDPSQLPYNLIINPNLIHLQHLQQAQQTLLRTNNNNSNNSPHHYHHNIIPYQIPMSNNAMMMSRNNSLPPVPKHQIVLPPLPQDTHSYNTINNNRGGGDHHSLNSNSLIHPIPSQLTPQAFGYSNETFHLQQSNHNHHHHHPPPPHNFVNLHHHHDHHPNNNHNQQQQPILHFSSQQQQNQHHNHQFQQRNPVIPPHSHTPSQLSNSNFSSSAATYQPQYQPMMSDQQTYSSSAVSSCAEFDHVYSTLDSPLQSPSGLNSDRVDFSPNGCGGTIINGSESRNSSSKHTAQHSTSSGVSSGSDVTGCGGESSNAVSPSSPIKKGILNKLAVNNNINQTNGKMYFV